MVFHTTLPRGGAFGAGLTGKRKRWGFSSRIGRMLILLHQRGLGTHLTMSKIQELCFVGACGEGSWKKACRTTDKKLFEQDGHKKDYPHMENLKWPCSGKKHTYVGLHVIASVCI